MVVTDFDKGLDFSALGSATGADHNNLIDLAVPHSDKGICIWSTDTALNTPDVPDPTSGLTFNKWKRYIWIRVPHSSATDKKPTLYAWNDNAASVTTYLKWLDTTFDDTDILAAIAILQTDVDDANNTANSASATASSAATNAATALTNSVAANTTAVSAAADAVTALDNSTTAQTTATAAQATADSALANAAAAQTTADTASAANAVLAARFTSALTAISAGPMINVAHGLGGVPRFLTGQIVCSTAEFGYAIGDEVDVLSIQSNGNQPAFALGKSVTNIFLIADNTAIIRTPHKTTGVYTTLTPANWQARLRAWL